MRHSFLHMPPPLGTQPKETTLCQVNCALYMLSSHSLPLHRRQWRVEASQPRVPPPTSSPGTPGGVNHWGFIFSLAQSRSGCEDLTEGV